MKHYVCTGDCSAEKEKPGICQAEGCSKEDQPLTECNCEDGLHEEAMMAAESDADLDVEDYE